MVKKKKSIKFLVYGARGGVINFKKKSEAIAYAKIARKKGLKKIGVGRTSGAAYIDNTSVIRKRVPSRQQFKKLMKRK